MSKIKTTNYGIILTAKVILPGFFLLIFIVTASSQQTIRRNNNSFTSPSIQQQTGEDEDFIKNKFGFEAELSGTSLDDAQPKGAYALGALTYKFNKRLRFDTGTRFGLSNEAPRVGFFAGFTVGVGRYF